MLPRCPYLTTRPLDRQSVALSSEGPDLEVYYYANWDGVTVINPEQVLCDQYPQYADNDLLVRYRPNYIVEFAEEEELIVIDKFNNMNSQKPSEKREIREMDGISVWSTKSMDRIRIFHLDELLTIRTSQQFDLLRDQFDGRYSELEVMGLCVYLNLVELPELLFDNLRRILTDSKDGLEARARLKPWSTSMKRWLPLWADKLGLSNLYPFVELETIFGYITGNGIDPSHVDDLTYMLSTKQIHWYGPDLFTDVFTKTLKHTWVPKGTPETFDLLEYFSNWNWWTTSGAASECRIMLANGKIVRINKSALPRAVSLEHLKAMRYQPNRVLIKSEVGKRRIAFSSPTYWSLVEGYLLKKYVGIMDKVMYEDFIAMTNKNKFDYQCGINDELLDGNYIVSSDIEKNDFDHDTYLDALAWCTLLEGHLSPEDTEIFLDLMTSKLQNWVLVREEIDSPAVVSKDEKGSHLLGRGGLMSGRRGTTNLNNISNNVLNVMAANLVYPTTGDTNVNYFGGDDSQCKADSYWSGWLRLIYMDCIMLHISPAKSYVSNTNGEFFRVATNGKTRWGYLTRVVHSVTQNNPVSAQPIDLLSRVRSLTSVLEIVARRGGDLEYCSSLTNYFVQNILHLDLRLLNIPVCKGGLGVGKPTPMRCTPGIPIYDPKTPDTITVDSWFDIIKMIELPDVRESYGKDMLQGVRDIENRDASKKIYKSKLKTWKTDMVILEDRTIPNDKVMRSMETYFTRTYENLPSYRLNWSERFQYVNSEIDPAISGTKDLYNIIDYQGAVDVINRTQFGKVRLKIRALQEMNLVEFFSGTVSSFSGSVLLRMIVGGVSGNSSVTGLPPDLAYLNKNSYPTFGKRS